MTETEQKTESQPSTKFRKIVIGGSHKINADNSSIPALMMPSRCDFAPLAISATATTST